MRIQTPLLRPHWRSHHGADALLTHTLCATDHDALQAPIQQARHQADFDVATGDILRRQISLRQHPATRLERLTDPLDQSHQISGTQHLTDARAHPLGEFSLLSPALASHKPNAANAHTDTTIHRRNRPALRCHDDRRRSLGHGLGHRRFLLLQNTGRGRPGLSVTCQTQQAHMHKGEQPQDALLKRLHRQSKQNKILGIQRICMVNRS